MRNGGSGSLRFDGKEYEVVEINSIKEIIDNTIYECDDRVAYMYKVSHKEPFRELKYGDFKELMDALGTRLIHMGLKGSKIAIIGENSYRYALTYFTTVCGVGVIVPIDRHLMQDEVKNLLIRADVEMIFADPAQLPKLRPLLDEVETLKNIVLMQEEAFNGDEDERVLSQDDLIDEGRELLVEQDGSYTDAYVDPESLATILFTSGTTGLAKGVMLSHKNFAKNVENMSKFFHAPKNTRALSILPMHHSYEMTCSIMTCFYQGKTIVFCEGLKYLQSNFQEAKCNVMLGVPLIFENIHRKIFKMAEKSGEAENLQKGLEFARKWNIKESKFLTRKLFKSIQDIFGKDLYCLIAGGAAIDPQVLVDFKTMGLPIIQGYGMTECAPIIALNPDRFSTDAAAGLPLPGTEIKIIDKDENGIGEVVCRSESVMMGYYKDPKATAETIDEDGWLHTGDYGFIDGDGWLYITGRKKNVIVTKGGKNIFPEEIELYLLMDEAISEVIVYGREDLADDVVCTALIVPSKVYMEENQLTTDEDMYDRIKLAVENANIKVPAYKRVRRIEIRDEEFIKTTTLKIKRFEKENYEYRLDSASFEEGRRF